MKSTDVNARLTEAILNILAKRPDGREAESFLISELRLDGWRGFGSLYEFERLIESLGFKIDRVRTKDGQNVRARYITL